MCSIYLEVLGPRACRNHKVLSFDLEYPVTLRYLLGLDKLLDRSRILGTEEGVRIYKAGQSIEIVHSLLLVDAGGVAEVNGSDVVEHIASQTCPVERL